MTTVAERRRHPRAEVDLLVQYRSDTFEDFVVAYATDVSEGGMRLASRTPLAVGAVVYLQLVLRDGTRLIEGLGRVAHADPRLGIMGVALDALDDLAARELRALVDARGGRPRSVPPASS